MALLVSIGFVIIPQAMPKKNTNDIVNTIDKTDVHNNTDIKSQLSKIVLELPDQRVHCDLYQELLHRLHDDVDDNTNTQMITTIDKEKLLIKIRQH